MGLDNLYARVDTLVMNTKHEPRPVPALPHICAICFSHLRHAPDGRHVSTSKRQREANREEVAELQAYRAIWTDEGSL